MKRFAVVGLYVLLCGVFFLAPVETSAQTAGIVPCSGVECQACHLVSLGQNIINWVVGITLVLAVAGFVYSGILYFTSAVNPKQRIKAKNIFINIIIGFLVVLGSWLAVQTILRAVLNDTFYQSWNKIDCAGERRGVGGNVSDVPTWIANAIGKLNTQVPTVVTGNVCPEGWERTTAEDGRTHVCRSPDGQYQNPEQQQFVNVRGVTAAPGNNICTDCTAITAGFQVKNNNQVNAGLNSQLASFAGALGEQGLSAGNVAITEAWPPTSRHSNPCHYNGTCVDIGLRGVSYTQDSVNAVQAAAANAGMCAVYETNGSCGGISNCLALGSRVTAPHFSLYQGACRQ